MKTPLQTILTDLISSFIKSKRLRVELLQDSDLGTFDYRTSIPKLADKCLNLVCIDMGLLATSHSSMRILKQWSTRLV